ncbi:MAG: GGDEF domain-containing protein [Oceanisphaera sp.]|uniref:GGDEF domain-containing protein n=1 Tax=Oceanisphaera sp. TaxID=1929979 RepID=UPI003F9D0B30
MINFDNKQMLKELASVINQLETLHSELQQPATASAPAVVRLASQWHKMVTGAQTPISAEQPYQPAHLSSTLTQQLKRLRNSHGRLTQLQSESEQKVQQASAVLLESGFSPPQTNETLLAWSKGVGHQNQLLQLLDYYQVALTNSLANTSTQQKSQHKLCSRLLQLIDELHFSGPINAELTKLREQLQQEVDPKTLPHICIQLIDIIIDGCRFERKNSTLFLANLNKHLEEVHRHFSITYSEGQSLFAAHTHHGNHIAGELRAIGEHLFNQTNTQLKADIQLRMRSINHILSQNERLQEREQTLLTRMNEMDQQLQTLKQEAEQYKQQLNAQNDKLFIDSLTQIHNRAGMDQRLDIEYRQWRRYDIPLCIVLLDIDHFKEINDEYGHLAGDKALRLIARTLKKSLRETDFIARFGGEEFIILLKGISQQDLDKPLQKLREKVKHIPFRFKENSVTITVSLGATLFKTGDSIHSAIERADQALYRAKNSGRDQFIID